MLHKSHGIVFFPDDGGTGDGSGDGDGAGDGDGEEEEEEEEADPNDIKAVLAENAKLKKAENRRRTAAAREAKAKQDAERKKAESDKDAEKLSAALAEEKARADAAELKANRALARSLAAEAGAVDPAVVVRLIDFDELSDASDEAEVKAEIAALLKDKPFLKGAKVKTDGGAGGKAPGEQGMNELIRGATGR